MKNIWIVFVFILLSSCNNNTQESKDVLDFVPDNSSLVISIKNPEILKGEFGDNDIINFPTKSQTPNALGSAIKVLNRLKTQNEVLLAFSKDSLNYSFITPYTDSLFISDTSRVKTLSQSVFKSYEIVKKKIDDDTLYISMIDSFFVSSNSIQQIEHFIGDRKQLNGRVLKTNSNASLSVHVLSSSEPTSATDQSPALLVLDRDSNLDMEISQDYVSLNGVRKVVDSSANIVSYFSKTIPEENKLATITPSNSKSFMSYTAHNFGLVRTNFAVLNHLKNDDDLTTIQDLVNEIGVFEIENRKAFAIRSIDVDALKESLQGLLQEIYRQTEIHELDSLDTIKPLFYPLISISNTKYCFTIDDFMVFTETLEDAQKIISSFTNKSTLVQTDHYKNLQDKINDESSLLYFANSIALDSVIANNLPHHLRQGLFNTKFKNMHAQVLQMTNDNGFAHASLIIQELKERALTNSISELFNIALDADILEAPQLVKNHVNGQMDILVQDVENTIYLISNRGKILWKKRVNGSILGKVSQIDIYKNGRLQLVFATPNALHVLDRNGNHVGPFPKKFNDAITKPLAVFDYDKTKNYRFLVVQGKRTYMYDKKGDPVNGFNFRSANQTIENQPKHFRIGNKDYIVFAAGKKMHILNRKGQTRIDPKKDIDFSKNAIYVYKGNFTTTNKLGQLVQVDQKGNVSTQNLLLSESHDFSATSKTLVSLDENKLTIRSKPVELDFGDYTKPKIFYLNDKIYVSVTDLQSQKTYLFDSQAKPIANFPIYGNSTIELGNADKDKNLEFVLKGDRNRIILYKLN